MTHTNNLHVLSFVHGYILKVPPTLIVARKMDFNDGLRYDLSDALVSTFVICMFYYNRLNISVKYESLKHRLSIRHTLFIFSSTFKNGAFNTKV